MLSKNVAESIRTMRQSRGWTQRDLAKRLGISHSTVAMWEIGKREPDFESLEALADEFNVPLSALTGGTDESKLPPGLIPISSLISHKVPMLGSMAAGEPVYDAEFPDVYVESPLQADFALKVKGDSMEPTYLDNDLVYVRQFPALPYGGAVVIVSIDDNVAIKHVTLQEDGIIITSDNTNYPPKYYSGKDHDIRILGVPVGYTRLYKR